jgi:ubiquinol-cytochrome c reductase iron-sulfur subunit
MANSDAAEPTRRDFLYIATGSVAAVGAGITLWPMIDQMNPDASVTALASIEVDISAIEEGQAITVKWRGAPIFIRYRTAKDIEQARAVKMDDLPDTLSRNKNVDPAADASDENRATKEKMLIMIGVCTHLGCIPKGQRVGSPKGDYGGWFCPCHGSHYDTAGRIRKGPAPRNLDVPVYTYLSDTKVKIG